MKKERKGRNHIDRIDFVDIKVNAVSKVPHGLEIQWV